VLGCPGLGGDGSESTGDGSGGSRPPVPLVFTSDTGAALYLEGIDSGFNFFACGITNDHQIHCWGTNNAGQLGHPDSGQVGPAPPRRVSLGTGQSARALAVGYYHACAILAGDAVKCWGTNGHGQLGLGDTINRGGQPDQMGDNLPALDFGPGLAARSIAAGEYHTCAILSDDSLRCWGGASAGELGTGERTNDPVLRASQARSVFPPGIVPTQVSCGSQHTCAIDRIGNLYCWGMNSDGELGLGDDATRYSPQLVDLGRDAHGVPHVARQVAAGGYHTCAILNDASVKCWGSNFQGELGIGSTEDHVVAPQRVALDGPARTVTIKQGHSCALLDDQRLLCWGMARLTRFNRVVGKRTPYPVTNLNGKRPSFIATGHDEACVVTDDHVTYCLDDMQLYDFRF
jgi:alpha-tubulin suppressor-like RCC1 family protein